MLIYDFVTVGRDFGAAREGLLTGADTLPHAAAAASTPDASLAVGTARERDDALVIPIAWSASKPGLFSNLDGDLQLAPLHPVETHLSLSGSCRPMPAPPGRRHDDLLARRAIETCVRDFLLTVGRTLELSAGDREQAS